MRGWTMVAVIGVGTVVLIVLGIRALLGGRRVPMRAKLAVLGAIVWLVSPLDPIPDFVPALGVLDDVAVLIAAIRYVLDQLEPGAPLEQRLAGRRALEASDWRLSDDDADR